jgi:hypothetical protein
LGCNGQDPFGIGVQIPLKSIFASICINMIGKKHQRLGIGIISYHVYSTVANEVREFLFIMNF